MDEPSPASAAETSATAPESGSGKTDNKPKRIRSTSGSVKDGKKVVDKPKSKIAARKVSRKQRTYPASTFEDALQLPKAILQHAPTGKIRRLTLFDELNRAPDSGASRQLITNSNAYGLTTGGYQAEYIEITPVGRTAVSSEGTTDARLRARFHLAIEAIAPFRELYEEFKGQKLPAKAVMRDSLREKGVDDELVQECIETFISNCEFLGLLQTIAGTERLLTLDHSIEREQGSAPPASDRLTVVTTGAGPVTATDRQEWANVCFYITPIGGEQSEERRHADMMMSSFIEPAMKDLNLTVVRADHIGDAGMITSQILEHLRWSRLAIADLSFLNPNVFYEMALRHARRLPVVQIIRKKDKLPFDVNQIRTVEVDTSDVYSLLPKLEVLRDLISSQARSALDDPMNIGNPVSIFYPRFYDE